jgi:curved DNA-binding protein CbpA
MFQIVDYYKVLQVDPDAHPEVIRAAYRVLARLNHPDIEGGSEEKMVALNKAWGILGDNGMRAAYDRSRAAVAHRTTPSQPPQREGGRDNPPGRSTHASTVLDFGRYAGWSLDQISRKDPDFLEWLARMPIGRPYRSEIEALLASQPQQKVASRR